VSGPLRLAAVDEDQKPLLDAFRAAHPEVLIGGGEFGTWQAIIPEVTGETTIVRYTLRELLGQAGRPAGGRAQGVMLVRLRRAQRGGRLAERALREQEQRLQYVAHPGPHDALVAFPFSV
jgi:hypothetical protein